MNGSLHDGNYSVVVSNDFGSVTSALPLCRWTDPECPYCGFDQYGNDFLPAGHLYDGQSDLRKLVGEGMRLSIRSP